MLYSNSLWTPEDLPSENTKIKSVDARIGLVLRKRYCINHTGEHSFGTKNGCVSMGGCLEFGFIVGTDFCGSS